MPVGNTALGMMGTLADYINQQRTQNRQSEDDQLEYQKQLIAQLANRPDANPALLGSALHDMAEMAGAKGGRSKLKGGSAGFFGAHQLPISQFLAGIQDGTRPLVGPTMGPDPNAQPPQGQPAQGAPPPGAQGPQTPPAAPASPAQQAPGQNSPQPGASVLQAPVAMPPPSTNGPAEAQGMLSGARDMMQEKGQNPGQSQGPTNPAQLQPPPSAQPAAQVPLPFAQQPYFISQQQLAGQAAAAAGQKVQAETTAKSRATLEGDIETANAAKGMDPQTRDIFMQSRGLWNRPPSAAANHTIYTGADGFVYNIDKSTNQVVQVLDKSGKPVPGKENTSNLVMIEGTTPGVDGKPVSTARIVDKSTGRVVSDVDLQGPAQPTQGLTPPPSTTPGQPPSPTTPPSQPPQAGATSIPTAPPVPGGPPVPAPDGNGWAVYKDGKIVRTMVGPNGQTAPTQGAAAAPGAIPTPPKSGGFTTGKPSAAAGKLSADEQKQRDAITQSEPMLSRVETILKSQYGNDISQYPNGFSSQLHEDAQRLSYKLGRNPSDPVYRELIPLVSFLKVFAIQPYLRGMRNFRYVQQIQEHIPNLEMPTPDTPAQIANKISVIRENYNNIKTDLTQHGGKP